MDKIFQQKTVPILQKAGVKKAAVFGSFARGEASPESDVDILVEFDTARGLFDLVELKFELEEALKKKVDIITYRSLSPLLKERIIGEAVSLV